MSITRSLNLIKKSDTSDILTRVYKETIRDISWKDRCFDLWLNEFLAIKHSWEIVSTSEDPVFMARISYPVMLELVEVLEKKITHIARIYSDILKVMKMFTESSGI